MQNPPEEAGERELTFPRNLEGKNKVGTVNIYALGQEAGVWTRGEAKNYCRVGLWGSLTGLGLRGRLGLGHWVHIDGLAVGDWLHGLGSGGFA